MSRYNRNTPSDETITRTDVTRIVHAPTAEEYLEEHPHLKTAAPKAKVLQQG